MLMSEKGQLGNTSRKHIEDGTANWQMQELVRYRLPGNLQLWKKHAFLPLGLLKSHQEGLPCPTPDPLILGLV